MTSGATTDPVGAQPLVRRDNIVWFVGDQLRADALAHLGNPASSTPRLDRLAAEGISFRRAYSQASVCVPSRCSFLTGLYPHTTGHRTMHFLQRPSEPNILKTMKANGYEVVWIGRNDVLPSNLPKTDHCDEYYDGLSEENRRDHVRRSSPLSHAPGSEQPRGEVYSFYLGETEAVTGPGRMDERCVDAALRYLERRRSEGSTKPFFIYCTLFFPHPPYGCEQPWYGTTDRGKLPPRRPSVSTLVGKPSMEYALEAKQGLQHWPETRWNELRATYLDMVAKLDDQLGQVCDKLKEVGEYDATNIFVFSDHGDYTGDYGIVEKAQNLFEDPLVNVPLIIKPSAHLQTTSRISETPVELLDLPVTIAEITGVPLDYVQFGRSLTPLFAGEVEHKDAVFSEGGRIHGEVQAMESGHGPDSPYWPRLSTQCSEGPEHTKALMIVSGLHKLIIRLYESDEFYDLTTDPQELSNAIDDPQYATAINELRLRALRHYQETTDYVPQGRDLR